MLYLLFILVFSILLIYYCKKFSFLTNYTGYNHQKFTNAEKVPLLGGVILILFLLILLPNDYIYLKIFCLIIFFIGLFSDTKKLNSPKLRLLLQIVVIFLFINILKISIKDTRIDILNFLINDYEIFSIFFTTFCFLIIINGSNFIDGANTLTVGYYISVLLALINIELNQSYLLDLLIEKQFLILLLAILIFNFFNKIFLGDNGAYLIGFLFSYLLIDIHMSNLLISPYIIVLLLWYPGFENLFSILRKYKFKKSPIEPDVEHFHQLFFFYLKKKNFFNKKYLSTATGMFINFYNLIIFLIASQNPSNSKFQIFLIFVSVLFYVIFYYKLMNYKKSF